MTETELIAGVLDFARDKGILDAAPEMQFIKTMEEFGETSSNLFRLLSTQDEKYRVSLKDDIGDVQVTVIILNELTGGKPSDLLRYSENYESSSETSMDAYLKLTTSLGLIAHGLQQKDYEYMTEDIVKAYCEARDFATMIGLEPDECLEIAYTEIAGRTGETRNGMFTKTEDLTD